ncbi:hypothetical protein SCUCBS95973_005113 [Sporothrix curviconia]|uniref:Uncharacterized protein n=1 Tax=Sporothrix curviconia TaxID=1260050 RepID=A0ABP0BUG3_9PEZI
MDHIKSGSVPGISLDLGTLGIVSGIVDALAQFPKFPEFAVHNTYNITLVSGEGRDNVEGPYYYSSGRNMYDIRRSADDPIISQDFAAFLGLASTRTALGLDSIPELSTTTTTAASPLSPSVRRAVTIRYLLDHGVRVILLHGDADYIANWYGGEAVSLAVNYSQAPLFRATPYTPLVFGDAADYGKVREQSNLSFAVVKDAGHFVPFDQPALARELFRRAMAGLDLPTGRRPTNSSAAFPVVLDSPLTTATVTTTATSAATATEAADAEATETL